MRHNKNKNPKLREILKDIFVNEEANTEWKRHPAVVQKRMKAIQVTRAILSLFDLRWVYGGGEGGQHVRTQYELL